MSQRKLSVGQWKLDGSDVNDRLLYLLLSLVAQPTISFGPCLLSLHLYHLSSVVSGKIILSC